MAGTAHLSNGICEREVVVPGGLPPPHPLICVSRDLGVPGAVPSRSPIAFDEGVVDVASSFVSRIRRGWAQAHPCQTRDTNKRVWRWQAHPHRTQEANERVGRWPPNPHRPRDTNERWQVGKWTESSSNARCEREDGEGPPNPRRPQNANERVAAGRPTLIEGETRMRGWGGGHQILVEREMQMRGVEVAAKPPSNARHE